MTSLRQQLETRLAEVNTDKLFNAVWERVLDKLAAQLADSVLDQVAAKLKDKIERERD